MKLLLLSFFAAFLLSSCGTNTSTTENTTVDSSTAGSAPANTRIEGLNMYDRKTGQFKVYKHQEGNNNSISGKIVARSSNAA